MREPKDISVYDLPAIVSLVQVITTCFLFYIVPAIEKYGYMFKITNLIKYTFHSCFFSSTN